MGLICRRFRMCKGVASSKGDLNFTDRRGSVAARSLRMNGDRSVVSSMEGAGVMGIGLRSGTWLGPAMSRLGRRRLGRGTGMSDWSVVAS
jgi:hypothetical protein